MLQTYVVITRGRKRNRREVYAAKNARHAARLATADGAEVVAVESLDTSERYNPAIEEY